MITAGKNLRGKVNKEYRLLQGPHRYFVALDHLFDPIGGKGCALKKGNTDLRVYILVGNIIDSEFCACPAKGVA